MTVIPVCCGEPMLYRLAPDWWRCAVAYRLLTEADLLSPGGLRVDVADLDATQRATFDHWCTSVVTAEELA